MKEIHVRRYHELKVKMVTSQDGYVFSLFDFSLFSNNKNSKTKAKRETHYIQDVIKVQICSMRDVFTVTTIINTINTIITTIIITLSFSFNSILRGANLLTCKYYPATYLTFSLHLTANSLRRQ